MSSTLTKRKKRRGMRVTQRDKELLRLVYEMRQLTAAQIDSVLFKNCHPSVGVRRRKKLRMQGFLSARWAPISRSEGQSFYVYSLGPQGTGIVAESEGYSLNGVRKRQRQDERLSWLWYLHREAITDVRLSFLKACNRQSYTLSWQTDEELAARKLTTTLNGKKVPILPDAFFTITLPAKRASFFLEVQRESRPFVWHEKARSFTAYVREGGYTRDFGAKGLRVLTVCSTREQAQGLHEKATELSIPELFWFGSLDQVCAEPLQHWLVGGATAPGHLV